MDGVLAAIKGYAVKGGRGATKMMLELFYVLKSPSTGMMNKTLIVAALGYQLLPKDLLPRSKFGVLGLLDNGITLAFAYKKVNALVTPEIEQQVKAQLQQWFGAAEAADDDSGITWAEAEEVK